MFDDAKHDDTELFEEEATVENEEPANESSSTEDFLADEQQDTTLTPKEKKQEDQVLTWTNRLLTGEIKSVNEIPESQKWLRKLVTERYQAAKQPDEAVIDTLVEKKLAQREAERAKQEADEKFLKLKSEISGLDLDADERAIIQAKYQSLIKKGLNRLAALEEAKSYFDLVNSKSERDMQALREAMGLPKVRPTAKSKSELSIDDPNFFETGSSKDRVAVFEKARMSRG